MTKGRKLYWAYGSNLCARNMRSRCPRARREGVLYANHAALVFRGAADVLLERGSLVPGGLWWITPDCEDALDRYEGVSVGLYCKMYFSLIRQGRKVSCLFYQFADPEKWGIMPPADSYVQLITEGYRDFGFDREILERALARSWEDKAPTPSQQRRYAQKGRPSLARALQ